MADITLTFTTSNLNEVKSALQHHKGVGAGSQSDANVKAFLVGHVDGMVSKYREKLRNDSNEISTTSTVSA
jgi:hypothetical protein